MDKNLEGEGGFAVRSDHVREFTAGMAGAFGAIPFEEIILIHVAILRGVALDAANGIGARHGRIIEGKTNEVKSSRNDHGASQRNFEYGRDLEREWRRGRQRQSRADLRCRLESVPDG